MDAKALLDAVLYPQNLDIGGDTLVQTVVVARALAEETRDAEGVLDAVRACVKLERVAALVAGGGGRLGLTPKIARTCVEASDEEVRSYAHKALDDAVGDEAELAADDVDADAGAVILVVGVLLYETARAPA